MNAIPPARGTPDRRPKFKRQTAPSERRRPKRLRSDHEFLAPALEILETPPSPIRLALIMAICALVVVALLWAYLSQMDIISVAQGKIEPSGNVKLIEPLETGKVAQILVKNGDPVKTGQTLIMLDDAELKSQLDQLLDQLAAAEAEVARRRAGIIAVGALDATAGGIGVPPIAWSSDIPEPIRQREEGVLRDDLKLLGDALAVIDSQIIQKSVDAKSLDATIAAQQGLVEAAQEFSDMRKAVMNQGAGSKADWLTALQSLQTQQVTLTTEQAERADDEASIAVLRQSRPKAVSAFLSDYAQKLADAEKQVRDLRHQVRQARARLDQMTLRSPIEGSVEASIVTTVGQVVSTGQEIMRIVPARGDLQIAAYLPNDEAGFVHAGQQATIKIATFPFTQYGTVTGKVIRVSPDAVTAADAQQALADASRPAASPAAGTAGSTQGLVFPIIVSVDQNSIMVDGRRVRFSPGMGVTVEVNTGKRSILDYLFSPIIEVTASAMRER
jgi:hemolysin D